MKKVILFLGAIVLLAFSTPTLLAAQVAPGTGGCDELCGTLYNAQGNPIGHACTTGGDRNRTNCVATVSDCTTDPCGGFAMFSADGRVLTIGTCEEKKKYMDEAQAAVRIADPASPKLTATEGTLADAPEYRTDLI